MEQPSIEDQIVAALVERDPEEYRDGDEHARADAKYLLSKFDITPKSN